MNIYICVLGYIKPGIFLNFKWPKITQSFFLYSYRLLRWWAPCRQEVWFVQLSVGVKASLVESQQMSSFVFISFYHLSICIHFLSCSFDVAFSCCINFLSFCCHVLSCSVAMYQRYRSSKADMLKLVRRVSAQTLASFFICRYRFCCCLAIVLEACAGCHLQVSWTWTCISSLSFLLLLSFSGSHLKYMPWQCLVWTSHISRVAISRFQMGPICQSTRPKASVPACTRGRGLIFTTSMQGAGIVNHDLGTVLATGKCCAEIVCYATGKISTSATTPKRVGLCCFPGSYHWTRLDVSPHNQTTLFGVFILFLSENHSKTLSENSGVFYQKFCWFKPIPTWRTWKQPQNCGKTAWK